MALREIVFVVFPGLQGLDLVGPAEVFACADQEAGRPTYRVRVAATTAGPLATHSGLGLVADTALADLDGPLDTLVVVGGEGTREAAADPGLLAEVVRLAPATRRTAGVCTGAFVLAAAGLLDGRRATTHWQYCDLLAELFPAVAVDPDPIFVRDGPVATSAGVSAGMDLALALVEEDLGRDVALRVARRLVLFLRRPGNQSQFSASLAAQMAASDGLRETQRLVVESPAGDWTVGTLARRANMSERHFARCFAQEVGVTPARFVESVRVEAARRLLEDSDDGVEAVARAVGFGTAETMRRAFLRGLRTSPTEYRTRFRVA